MRRTTRAKLPTSKAQIRALMLKRLLRLQDRGLITVNPLPQCPGFGYEVTTPEGRVAHYFPGSGRFFRPCGEGNYQEPLGRHQDALLKHLRVNPWPRSLRE